MKEGIADNVIPALEALGLIPAGLTVEFPKSEDITQLWSFYKDGLSVGLQADIDELNAKFGTKFTGYQQAPADKRESDKNGLGKNKNAVDFFD